VFRHRRSPGAHRPGRSGQPDTAPEETGAGPPPAAGPWDADESYPEQQRLDLGSLLIPVVPGMEVQLNVAEEQIAAASVSHGRSSLQVQALAAPKSGGLWHDVRDEVAAEVSKLGGQTFETEGPFGTEVRARMPAEPGGGQLEPARFFGVDGPRWLLRGVIRGEAAADDKLAGPLEDVFAGIVVVRGDHPAPPRDLLEIRLPAELRQAMEQEMAQAEERRRHPSPFERGPEITETR
jgi:hypothetical protein